MIGSWFVWFFCVVLVLAFLAKAWCLKASLFGLGLEVFEMFFQAIVICFFRVTYRQVLLGFFVIQLGQVTVDVALLQRRFKI